MKIALLESEGEHGALAKKLHAIVAQNVQRYLKAPSLSFVEAQLQHSMPLNGDGQCRLRYPHHCQSQPGSSAAARSQLAQDGHGVHGATAATRESVRARARVRACACALHCPRLHMCVRAVVRSCVHV